MTLACGLWRHTLTCRLLKSVDPGQDGLVPGFRESTSWALVSVFPCPSQC